MLGRKKAEAVKNVQEKLVTDALNLISLPSCSTTFQLCFNRYALYLSSQLHKHGTILKQHYIDSSFDKETDVAKKMEVALHPLSFEAKSSEWTPTWSTNHPPFVVLDKLTDLGFSVVAANTVGVTFVWTLQGNMNVQSLRRPIRNDQRYNYAGTMPYNY